MFNKPPSNARPDNAGFEPTPPPVVAPDAAPRKATKIGSLLAADLTIEGNLTSQGEAQIDGTVRGDVRAPRLSIGESGQIEGAVHAEAVEVRGRVVGSITAKQVRLLATSHVDGDITHEQLTMETGAHFQGRSLKFQRPAASAEVVSITPAQQQG